MAFYYVCPNAGINSPKFISSLLENLICLIVIIKQHHMQMSSFFFKLNLLSINSDSVFGFLGRHTSRHGRKGVYVRWHPGAIRKPSCLSISNRHNPLPWSGCVNLQEIKSRPRNGMIWEPGKSQERTILSKGLCHGQVLPTKPEEVWTLWAVCGSLVWEMHQHKAGHHCLFLIRRGELQRGLGGGNDCGLPCFRQDWETCSALYSVADLGLIISDKS